MRKGFGALFFIIAVFFIAAPFAFYITSIRSGPEVRGASTSGYPEGFSIVVNSSQGTWDLYQYGCADLDECRNSLFSGKKVSMTSGGATKSYTLPFAVAPDSQDIKYVKYFVKPGWGSAQRTFSVNSGKFTGVETTEFEPEGKRVNVLIVPVEAFTAPHFMAGSFSD
ncbi:MAG: hypothetical protein ACD_25C00157G0002 [uncultured bacterium]|uniref:Uncharacterized protein n=2 Tax=Katanobacteria TaxID=422282 RepID=A0A1F4W3M8_UNCKA|nr:MAG: hypothetical protein ACD_25C00157G0002 [uncultured bacterium]KKS02635.1 MAG: hypothetical protein UU55_C0013G0006 [candidate division WWE3 bacterium GW2011_GWC2_41_23]KKS09963.1 MAG: hypothetical protein UU64_C0012G0006 [candidate division WWE3 bacterium GW2011_GWF2_41_45]KKS19803.1 MAG: hypothetical protein UU79_C0009G0014 [candidate division WWE3 bacterium GW2011_GWE1_41_72]KKS27220.1 MAG: hypothetical protein UU86_C0023G0022 [candidate division WWE3 bacterium GW2011_GWC1_42_102]KKS3